MRKEESKKRVLLVDDNFFNIDVLKQLLSYHVPNTEVFSFFSPIKTLASLKEIIDWKPKD